MYIKDFEQWFKDKVMVNDKEVNHLARAGEVRWAALGVNVGSEIDGKNAGFTRPVYIVCATGPDLVLVIPMSTKLKESPGYFQIMLQSKEVSLCLHQVRTVSKRRIYGRIGKLGKIMQDEIRGRLKNYLHL